MNNDPRFSGNRGTRSGYVYPGNHEDAKRRYQSFPKSLKYTIIIVALVALYVVINMALNSHELISNRNYESVDSILIDESVVTNDNYNDEELFKLLKNTWTKVPSASLLVSEAEEFIQHQITVVYIDGTMDEIVLYYNPYSSSKNNGYVLRTMMDEDIEKLVLSYNGYDKLMEYIENSLE